MGYLETYDPGGWVAIQVSSFLEKIRRNDDLYQVSDLLEQTDNLAVCKGIIRQLAKDNQTLRKQNRRLRA